jgi:hypothetical protein
VSKPVVIDLCCGLGGWTRGFLAEGYEAIGFDVERHEYGGKRYPAELILKDIRQVCGYELRAVNPVVIVGSPPCQAYSHMAMPFSVGKRKAAWQRWERDSPFGDRLAGLNALFDACFRIARECGVPIVVENVKGAQPWVGRAKAHFGNYYLWGDVESVGGRIVGPRPQFGQSLRAARRSSVKVPGLNWSGSDQPGYKAEAFNSTAAARLTKNEGGSWFNQAHNTESGVGQNPVNGVKVPGNDTFKTTGQPCGKLTDPRYPSGGVKQGGSGPEWFDKALDERRKESGQKCKGDWFNGYKPGQGQANNFSGDSRKAASAMIAEIPFDLAQWVAKLFLERRQS